MAVLAENRTFAADAPMAGFFVTAQPQERETCMAGVDVVAHNITNNRASSVVKSRSFPAQRDQG